MVSIKELQAQTTKEETKHHFVKSSSLAKQQRNIFFKLLLLIVSTLCIAIFIALFVIRENGVVLTEQGIQYYAGDSYPVASGTRIMEDYDGKSVLLVDGEEREISSLVIYTENKEELYLTHDMIYCDPRTDTMKRVDAFTKISVQSHQMVASNGKNEVILNNGFLYDGADYYVFLEGVDVAFNNYKLTLGPLSYVEANYQNIVMTFDYTNKESFFEEPKTEVEVSPLNEDYRVELFNGLIENYKNEKSLIFNRADLLDSIFE